MADAEPRSQLVYCDYNATAPLRTQARTAMLPWLGTLTGNPSSVHAAGQAAADAVAGARAAVADLIGARASEIVFTSGATEANNLALHAALAAAPDATLIVSAVEHPAVLAVAEARMKTGGRTEVIPVGADGDLDLSRLRVALDRAEHAVVSVMAANNETGILFDLPAIAAMTHDAEAILHTDATQRAGRLPTDIDALGVDLLSMSAHKFGGPMGVGALYIARDSRIPVRPLVHGGEQEQGWRSGTLNVPAIVGFGAAAAAAAAGLAEETVRVAALRDRFESAVLARIGSTAITGLDRPRLPGTSSVACAAAPAQAVLAAMPDVAASDGSACASGAPHPSHVLLAMGRSADAVDNVVRFSFGHATTESDIDRVVRRTADAVARVRAAALRSDAQEPIRTPRHRRNDRREAIAAAALPGGTR